MGKYVNARVPKYLVFVDPEEAARRVIEAWERFVRDYAEVAADEYRDALVEFSADANRQNRAVEKLRTYYERIIPEITAEFREVVGRELEVYKTAELPRVIAEHYGIRRR